MTVKVGLPQEPFWHVSPLVQASPSLQAAPFVLAGLEHVPVAGSQVPATWHWSEAVQATGVAPAHVPPWQVSVCVQALPSRQTAPLGMGGVLGGPGVRYKKAAARRRPEAGRTHG